MGIKFESSDEQQKLFVKTLRSNVNNYFKEKNIPVKGNFLMLIKSVVMLLFYMLPYFILLSFHVDGMIWTIILVIVMGIGKAGIGMSVMHDAIHGSYSSKKWVNKLMGSSMYLIGSNVLNWKIQHNIYHHAYTNIDGFDEDIQTRWILRLCEHTALKPIHRFQHVYAFFMYCLMSISMIFGDITQLITYSRNGILEQFQTKPVHEFLKVLIIKILYLFIMIGLPLILTDYKWWQVVCGFFIMHFVAGFIMTLVFQLAHIVEGAKQPLPNEHGCAENEWAIHQLLSTSDFARDNRLLSWYVGGLNFQIEHHLFPNICHLHYREISFIVERTAAEFNIHYNLKPTLRKAIGSHIRKLKELGRSK